MSLCKHFKCTEDSLNCLEYYNGICDGTSYEGHQRCGCDFCVYQRYEEDVEVCTNERRAKEKELSLTYD